MLLYRLLSALFPRSLLSKVTLVIAVAVVAPTSSLAALLLLHAGAGRGAVALLVGVGLVAAVAGGGLVRLTLAPVWAATEALEAHARGWSARPLPEGHHDLLGLLMRRANHAVRAASERLDDSRREAALDPLTGVHNRRGLDRALAGVGGGCVVMCDLDHFKRINDAHGHEEGDRVLRSAAAAWRRRLREGDVLARVGGEEFVVFLPATTVTAAARRAGELRAALSSEVSVAGRPVTASFGVAARGPREATSQALDRADAALYRAKRGGRDRVCVAGLEMLEGGAPTPSGEGAPTSVTPARAMMLAGARAADGHRAPGRRAAAGVSR